MARKSRQISSMEELMQAVPEIIAATDQDPSQALRFAANPLLLAEELGYTLNEEMMHFASRRVRFNKRETYERLVELEKQVWEHAGERFDLDSGRELAHILFNRLKLSPPGRQDKEQKKTRHKQGRPASEPDESEVSPDLEELAAPLSARPIGHEPKPDRLESLRNAHPIMTPLLEYRQIEASCARLAPRAVYDRIKRGDVDLPITSLRLRLKINPTS